MKNNFLIMLILLTLTLISCQKEEVYSCNAYTNKVITKSLSQIQSMSRTQWLTLNNVSDDYKIATFRAFTPNQKRKFLLEKMSETKCIDWSSDELEHINQLQSFIEDNQEMLNHGWENNDELKNKYDIFQYQWVNYAKETLKWTNEQIYAVGFSPGKMISKSGNIIGGIKMGPRVAKSTKLKSTRETEIYDCYCDEKFTFCQQDDPAIWWVSCVHGNCKVTDWGCQLALLGKCRGTCVNIIK